MKEITNEDKLVLIKVKSLLNHLSYIIKEEDKRIMEDFHKFCRKHCIWEQSGE